MLFIKIFLQFDNLEKNEVFLDNLDDLENLYDLELSDNCDILLTKCCLIINEKFTYNISNNNIVLYKLSNNVQSQIKNVEETFIENNVDYLIKVINYKSSEIPLLKSGFDSVSERNNSISNIFSEHKFVNTEGITTIGDCWKCLFPGDSIYHGVYFYIRDCEWLISEGSFLHGNLFGQGKKTFSYGIVEEGFFTDDKLTYGKKINDLFIYEGNFVDGLLTGEGKESFSNSLTREGIFEKGCLYSGKITCHNIKISEGDFKDGKLYGLGKVLLTCGDSYEGIFENGKLHGLGKIVHASGYSEGIFENGMLNGLGKIVYASGSYSQGIFENGMLHGLGKEVLNYVWNEKVCSRINEGIFIHGEFSE